MLFLFKVIILYIRINFYWFPYLLIIIVSFFESPPLKLITYITSSMIIFQNNRRFAKDFAPLIIRCKIYNKTPLLLLCFISAQLLITSFMYFFIPVTQLIILFSLIIGANIINSIKLSLND